MTDDIVLITGGFDPIHSGHIAYINAAAKLGRVVVGVNSDKWLIGKKGAAFMPLEERMTIIMNLKTVMAVVKFDDSDGSAKDAIRCTREMFPKNHIIFANGGDRTSDNIPEMDIEDDNVEFVFGVGGEDKKNSSSWILQEWKSPKTERPWGYYRVLHEVVSESGYHTKVKELTVMPGQSLSMQRHENRFEIWHVAQGTASINYIDVQGKEISVDIIELHRHNINRGSWHQLFNKTDKPIKIIEIQYGSSCIEADIERK